MPASDFLQTFGFTPSFGTYHRGRTNSYRGLTDVFAKKLRAKLFHGGEKLFREGDECVLAHGSGVTVLNMRPRLGWSHPGDRIFSISNDKGQTWTAPTPWSFQGEPRLEGSKWFPTEASMVYMAEAPHGFLMSHPGARAKWAENRKNVIVADQGPWERRDLRIYYSYGYSYSYGDMVWREASINADFGRGPAGYSALVHLGGHTYGCLWEQGPADFIQNLKFTVFSTGFVCSICSSIINRKCVPSFT